MSIEPFKNLSENVIELFGLGDTEQKAYLKERLKEYQSAFKLHEQLKRISPDIIELALYSDMKPKDFRDEIADMQEAIRLMPAFERLSEDEADELFEYWGNI